MFKSSIAIGIKVFDFEESFKFYKNNLKLEVNTEDQENKFAEFKVGDLTLALLTENTLEEMCGNEYFNSDEKSNHLISVEVKDLNRAYQRLREKNVEFMQPPKTTSWGQNVAYFKDINGYIWELSEPFEEN